MFEVFLRKFSIEYNRFSAIMCKEFKHMLRDPSTVGMMIGTPIIQLILFGYAINMTPTHLPTIVVDSDQSYFSRTYLAEVNATGYFDIAPDRYTEEQANEKLLRGEAQFIINIPYDFSRKIVRGEKTSVLLDADATDPVASSSSIQALSFLSRNIFSNISQGSLELPRKEPGVSLQVHSYYNPINSTQWNIIPGLIGVVLTLTLVMVTSMALAKELEAGTQEFILATPATPIEVVLGKMTPYLLVGYIQIGVIILLASILMGVPFKGSVLTLLVASFPYVLANLAVGLLISTIARTQIQASVSATFFFLPSLMLSGFFFPFRGMPFWAQHIGHLFPLSHYLVIVRGVMLKGASLLQVMPSFLAISLFALVMICAAIFRYRGTLD